MEEMEELTIMFIPKEEDMEIFTTRPGYPNKSHSSELTPNTVGVESLIYQFQLPTGYHVLLNPKSDFDGVLVRPYDNK